MDEQKVILSTKETEEVLAGAEIIAFSVAKILADGKINFKDSPEALALFSKKEELLKMIQGANLVDDEMKALIASIKNGESLDIACDIIAKIWGVASAIKKGLEAGKA